MPDMKKVQKGLAACRRRKCMECPYGPDNDCGLFSDAIALIEAQEEANEASKKLITKLYNQIDVLRTEHPILPDTFVRIGENVISIESGTEKITINRRMDNA